MRTLVQRYHMVKDELENLFRDTDKGIQSVATYEGNRLALAAMQQERKILLDVGGIEFETVRSVLTSPRAEDSMLFAIGMGFFEDNNENKAAEPVFIDRDGAYFAAILNWLRDGDESSLQHFVLGKGRSAVASTGEQQPYTHSTSREDNVHNLLVEARYYGLDQLVATLTKVLCVPVASCWLSACNPRFYHNDTASRCSVVDTSGSWIVPLSQLLLPGMRETVEVKFQGTDRFGFYLYDGTNNLVAGWSTAMKSLAKCLTGTPAGVHTLAAVLDWTKYDTSSSCFALNVTVTVDGSVIPNPKLDLTANSRLLSIWLGTHTKGSEMWLHSIQVDELHPNSILKKRTCTGEKVEQVGQ